jgi:hypothetical protein
MPKKCGSGEQGGLVVAWILLVHNIYVECAFKLQSASYRMVNELSSAKFSSLELKSSSCLGLGSILESSYLVDPASSHMLVSKIKPCMSKYKQICTVKLRMAH